MNKLLLVNTDQAVTTANRTRPIVITYSKTLAMSIPLQPLPY